MKNEARLILILVALLVSVDAESNSKSEDLVEMAMLCKSKVTGAFKVEHAADIGYHIGEHVAVVSRKDKPFDVYITFRDQSGNEHLRKGSGFEIERCERFPTYRVTLGGTIWIDECQHDLEINYPYVPKGGDPDYNRVEFWVAPEHEAGSCEDHEENVSQYVTEEHLGTAHGSDD